MSKKRVSLRLADNEIAVVGTVERWQHLVMVYEAYAQMYEGEARKQWLEAANWIRDWIAAAKVDAQEDEW